jgi:hypothetical protein
MSIKFPFLTSILFRTFAHPTDEKLFDFSLLKRGWNYGEGEVFSTEAINSARDLHREIIFRGYSTTDAFPGLDGEIQVTVYEGDHFLTFEFDNSGTWSVTHETGDKSETAAGLNLEQVKEYLNSINSTLCNASDYYRGETIGTSSAGDLMTWRSSPELMESQCLTENAL